MNECKNCLEMEKFYKAGIEAQKANLLHMGAMNDSYKKLEAKYDALFLENLDLKEKIFKMGMGE